MPQSREAFIVPMVTRCPGCNTLFRVTPEQLQAHQGDVRCGRCMMVFNGFKGLAMLPDTVPSEPQAPAQAPAVDSLALTSNPLANAQPQSVETQDGAAAEPTSPASVVRAVAEEEELVPAASSEPQVAASMLQPGVDADAPRQTSPAAAETAAGDDESISEEPEPRYRSQGWAIASALLLLALIGQAAYLYRTELASSYPGLKPVLASMCRALGCVVPLPQRPKLIYIEASDMQAPDPAHPNQIRLTATLRNHAGYDVAYPALDLVLTNTTDHGLARRIFMPEEYIGHRDDVKRGIPASAEFTVRLDLDTGDLGAAGFRLDLLPAPVR